MYSWKNCQNQNQTKNFKTKWSPVLENKHFTKQEMSQHSTILIGGKSYLILEGIEKQFSERAKL